jgi:hypothetical protein
MSSWRVAMKIAMSLLPLIPDLLEAIESVSGSSRVRRQLRDRAIDLVVEAVERSIETFLEEVQDAEDVEEDKRGRD